MGSSISRTRRARKRPAATVPDTSRFMKLPSEIRRMILIEAFGNMTIHIQVTFRKNYKLKIGSVCHRHLNADKNDPASDICLTTTPRTGPIPLGISGWLLTCNQAYDEGGEVLYSCNTICIFVRAWLLQDDGYLKNYIPSPYLSLVRSLELIFDPNLDTAELIGDHRLERLLQSIPPTMPQLSRLYIGFLASTHFFERRTITPKAYYIAWTMQILPILDKMAQALGNKMVDLEVTFPTSVFQATFAVGVGEGHEFQIPNWKPEMNLPQGGYHPRQRIWRAVHAEEGAQAVMKLGYWVGEAHSDMPHGWMIDMPRYWE